MLILEIQFTDMNKQIELLQLAKQVQALAENGLHYSENDYDLDRYSNLEEISLRMISLISGLSEKTIEMATPERNGYRTPKVDIRCVIFNERDEILMVQERIDSRWSLPGGWCDVGYTPTEVAEKEAMEEAGIRVKAGSAYWPSLIRNETRSPRGSLYYAYKIFLECKPENLEIRPGMETLDVGFFARRMHCPNYPLPGTPSRSDPARCLIFISTGSTGR
jgi:ADP-ribose pyrophosphatase YjhB (NUDIX family)